MEPVPPVATPLMCVQIKHIYIYIVMSEIHILRVRYYLPYDIYNSCNKPHQHNNIITSSYFIVFL